MFTPIAFQEVLSYKNLGISSDLTNASRSFLSQDKYLWIREDSYIFIVDLLDQTRSQRNKITADSSAMHPSKKIIALKNPTQIQIFDLDSKKRLNTYQIQEGQKIKYWKWIDDQTLAFSTDESVYHAFITNQNLEKIFYLQSQIESNNISDYCVSSDHQWFAISSFIEKDSISSNFNSKVQLYSRETKISQFIDAYTATFANIDNFPVLIYATKEESSIRINIFALGTTSKALIYGTKHVDIQLSSKIKNDELPTSILFSPHYNTAFILTKCGYLHCVEITTPFVYMSTLVSDSPFTIASLTHDGNVIALNKIGQLKKYILVDENLIDYIREPMAAFNVAKAAGLEMQETNLLSRFNELIEKGNYSEAASIASKSSPYSLIRRKETIEKLRQIPLIEGTQPPLLQYFMSVLVNTRLNEVESIELCKIVLNQNRTDLIEKWIKEDMFTFTEELGDICKQDQRIALAIYLRANASSKIVASFAGMGMFDKLQSYCQKFSYKPNWMQIATITARQSPDNIGPVLTHIANKGYPLADPKALVQMLLQFNLVKAAVSFLEVILLQNREKDSELQPFFIDLTNQHQLYKEQAHYCIELQSPELWARVLSPGNEHMKLVTDAVISTISEYYDPDKISQTVKAFIDAQILTQLLDLLEKVIMEKTQFQNNTSLQNLLIITAIKSDKSRVMKYVTRLNDYTWDKICEHLIIAQFYDEAIAAYKKFGQNVEAVRVMLNYNSNIQAALDLAQQCNEPDVWFEVSHAQLAAGQVVDAIDSFIKANDDEKFIQAPQDYITKLLNLVQHASPTDQLLLAEAKAFAYLVVLEMYDKLDDYCKKISYKPNWKQIEEIISKHWPNKISSLNKYLQKQKITITDSNVKTKSPIKFPPFRVNDNDKIEQNILQYFIDIAENRNMIDTEKLNLILSTITQNKSILVDKWKTENKEESQTNPNQNQLKILSVEDIEKNYCKVERIGRGATSEVFKVTNGEYLALKTIFIDQENKVDNEEDEEEECDSELLVSAMFDKMKRFMQEYEIMNMIQHPNIVKAYGYFIGDKIHPPSILLEYCPTNLKKKIRKLTNIERASIIFQISSAMKKVHSMKIIHRDLKPENILLTSENDAKLSDFGFSKLVDSRTQSQMSIVGTMNFMAPEILLQKDKYNEKVDVYSFGVLLYFILTNGKLPTINIVEISQGVKAEIPNYINDFSREMISKCWNFEPDERPSFEEICNEIVQNDFQIINGIDSHDPVIIKLNAII